MEAPIFTQGLHPNLVGFSQGMNPGVWGDVGVTCPSPWVAAVGLGLARGLQWKVGDQELIPGVLNFPNLIPTEQPIPTSRFPRFGDGASERPLGRISTIPEC